MNNTQLISCCLAMLFLLVTANARSADAQFTIAVDESSFAITDYDTNPEFNIEMSVAETLLAGGIYNNPFITQVDYLVNGVLGTQTSSGFPGLGAVGTLTKTEFYNQSPESALEFSRHEQTRSSH